MEQAGLEECALVQRMLPAGWQAQARQLGALRLPRV